MRDTFLLAIFIAYLAIGARAPFVLALGYIWADYFSPQQIGYSYMTRVPVSLILGVAALIGFALTPKKDLPRIVPGIWLLLLWAAWITLTTTWAEVPDSAWSTWDWSIKTILFAAFLPFLFRTRIQLESMLLTVTLGIGGTLISFAAKTVLGGGRYGAAIGLQSGNSGLAEQATLATVAVAIIPILLYLHNYGVIIKNRSISFLLFYGLSAAAIIASIGTFERTAVITLGVLGLLVWWNGRRKVLIASALVAIVTVAGFFVSEVWVARMGTIQNYQGDVSAMGRLSVWKWTMDYAMSHPWGGGFNVYLIDEIEIPVQVASQSNAPLGSSNQLSQFTRTVVEKGRAFHSTYFQILGEHGFPGVLIFALIIIAFFLNARRIRRSTKDNAELSWAHSLARTLSMSAIVYLAGATFVGIAFQPFLYDLIAAGVVLNECVRRYAVQPSDQLQPAMPLAKTAS